MSLPVPSAKDGPASEIAVAARAVRSGGVVVVPTDTLFGLAADVFQESAVRRVFVIKGRPQGMAMPVLVASWQQALEVTESTSEVGRLLARRFWPGALTLVFPRAANLPDLLTGGGSTVAVRMPEHWAPLALCQEVGPVTGTSANVSGAADLLSLDDLEGPVAEEVDYIIRAGPVPGGISSTVVDVTSETPTLLRQGALPFGEVLAACR